MEGDKMKLYRIYTEDKNRADIEELAGNFLPSCTIYQAIGLWQGSKEHSLIIEYIDTLEMARPEMAKENVHSLAVIIKKHNKQQAVLVTEQEITGQLI
jgi:hypothetical protein